MSNDLYPTPLAAAQMYAVMGWRVAPVAPGSKVPIVKEWQKAATTDADIIAAWWANNPDAGVCIITGKQTGLWCLDVDVSDGKLGLETLRALVAANGPLGETLVARTPSGGYHYYFEYPELGVEIHNSASNRLGAGLDVRGEGGQVNAPPTARGESGYSWADGRAPWSAEAQPAPAWLLDLVKDEPKPLLRPEVSKGSPVGKANDLAPSSVGIPTHSPTAALAIRKQTEILDTVPTFVTDYNARTSWEQLLTNDGWTPCQTHGDIDYWARLGKSCREGISGSTNYAGSDLLYVWSTSIEGLPSDRAFDRYGYMVHRDFGGSFDAAASHFTAERRADRAKGEVLVGQIQPADLLATESNEVSSKLTEDEDPSKFEAALMRLDLPAFWDNDPTAKDWLIEPFLANGRAHALYASAKAGKSYIALQAIAAACVPGHTSWATTPAELIRVLYLDYEMTEDDLRERLTIFGYGVDDDYSRLHYVKASLLGADLDTKDGGRELTDQALAWGVQLVVVDTMSRAVSGDENDADTVRKFYQHTGRLLKAHGIAWLRIDHAGKDGEKGQRGSSAKNDDVDVVWRLQRLDAGARLTRTHSRVFWIDDEILLANVSHPSGGVTHERTHSAEQVQGITAKAREWLRLGIPLNVSRDALRDEWEFQFDTNAFGVLKRRVQQLAEEAGYAQKPASSEGPSYVFPLTDRQTERPDEAGLFPGTP